MRQLVHVLFSVMLFVFSGCISNQGDKYTFSNNIQPYADNPKYWQYKGEPVLLLGGEAATMIICFSGRLKNLFHTLIQ